MFRTVLLSTIRSLNTVVTAIAICHTIYVDCQLARSGDRELTYILLAFIIRIDKVLNVRSVF